VNTEKTCSLCLRVLPLDNFGVDKSTPCGFSYRCKSCKREQSKTVSAVCSRCRTLFKARPDQIDKSGIIYCSRSCAARSKRPRALNRETQDRCGNRLRYLIRSGRVLKPTACSKCRKTTLDVDGHHPDYTKPEVVVWLCRSCHHSLHLTPLSEQKVSCHASLLLQQQRLSESRRH
jgi:hypothetical protein